MATAGRAVREVTLAWDWWDRADEVLHQDRWDYAYRLELAARYILRAWGVNALDAIAWGALTTGQDVLA